MKKILFLISIICFSLTTYAQNSSKEEIKVSNKILKSYVGKYELSPNAVIDISKDENQLFVQLTGQPKFEIFPSSKTVFFLKVVEATITFNKDEKGKVISLILNQNGQTVTAKKLE